MKLRKDKTLYVGHRGSESALAVENTKDAYIGGAKDHYDGLECDIQITKDDKYVCFHNRDLSEHTKDLIKGKISDYTLQELKEITLYDIVQKKEVTGVICTFDEYLEVLKEYHIYGIIELKNCEKYYENNFAHITKVMNIIKEKGLIEMVSMITFVPEYLYFLRENYPELHLQLIYDKKVTKELQEKCFEKKINLDVRFDKCRHRIIKAFHKHNLEVNSWTVNWRIVGFLFKLWNIDMLTSDVLKKPRKYLTSKKTQ